MATDRIELGFHATDSADAIAQAKEWVKGEPALRLRTIGSCRPVTRDGVATGRWTVVVVVSMVDQPDRTPPTSPTTTAPTSSPGTSAAGLDHR